MGYQEKVSSVWKESMASRPPRGYPLLDWDGAAKLINIFQPAIYDLKLWEESKDPASWLSQKPIESVAPQLIKNKYYEIVGIAAKDVTAVSVNKNDASYGSDGFLTEANSLLVYKDSKQLAIHLDVLADVPENLSIWADIAWQSVKDTGSGLAKIPEVSIGWGKWILIGCGVLGGGLLLAKVFGSKKQ